MAQSGTMRPGGVTTAAVLLIVLGAIYGIIGLLMAIAGGGLTGVFGSLGGAVIVIGLIVIVFGALYIMGGVKSLQLRPGGRTLGIVMAIIGGVFSLLSIIGSFSGGQAQIDPETFEVTQGGFNAGNFIMGLLFLIANIAIVVLLARNGPAFTGAPGAMAPPPPATTPPPPA